MQGYGGWGGLRGRCFNEELQRRIEAADSAIQSLRVALSEGGTS
jgi:hypothetical protein